MPVAVKRGLFALTDAEEASPNKMVKFASTLPAVVKSGNESKDEDMEMARDAMMKTINLLWRNPSVCMKNNNWLEKKIASDAAQVGNDYFKAITTIGKLDETWAVAWLVSNSPLTLELIEDVSAKDPDSWRQLYMFALVCSLHCKCPESLRNKALCSMTLHARHVLCGRRLSKLRCPTFVNEENECIDWKHIGVYEPLWHADDEKSLKVLRHKPTGHLGRIPDHVLVSREFKLWYNWDDFEASFVLTPSNFKCCDFFESGSGPFGKVQWAGADKSFKALADAQNDIHQAAMEELQDMTHDVMETPQKFRATAKQALNAEGMNTARDALKAKQTQLNNMRSVKLG